MLSLLVRKILRYVLIAVIAAAALGAIVAIIVMLAPWQDWAEAYLKRALTTHGYADPQATIKRLDRDGATLAGLRAARNDGSFALDELRVTLDWAKGFPPALDATLAGFRYDAPQLRVTIAAGRLNAAKRDAATLWRGDWTLDNIVIKNSAQPLPPLQGRGTLTVENAALTVAGDLRDATGEHAATLTLTHRFYVPDATRLRVGQATLPWQKGRITVRDLALPLADNRDVMANLEIERVSADALLQMMTADKAGATGTVSGVLPVTLRADGTMLVRQGALRADAPGTITVTADAIPGDQAQLGLLRDVLNDFRYRTLTIEADSDDAGKLKIGLTVEGSNPAVQSGRAVKLNVNLTGDVLDFVRQNVMLLLDPVQLLRQGNHAR